MQTREVQVNSLFEPNVQYRIPLFQRHYVWDNENQWQPLWDDLTERADLRLLQGHSQQYSHFTGAIVLQQKMTGVGVVPKYEIIDGQQRLTTFQIIFCALRDICESLAYSDIADEVRRYILNQGIFLRESDEEKYKLIPTEFDRTSFQSLVDECVEEREDRIQAAYDYFKNQISGYVNRDRERILALLLSVLNDFGFVQILLDSNDKPERIFESINARGKNLLQFDLLRNNLFLSAREDRDRLYTTYWQDFETQYWDAEVKSGTSSELFLQHFLMTKLGTERVKPEFNVYQRQYRGNLEETQGIEYEFSELKRYAEIYQEMTDCEDDSEIGRRMRFYATFELTTLHPFILFVICEIGLSGPELNHVFNILEAYTIRRMLCCGGKRALKNYNIFFSEFIREFRDNFSLVNLVSRLSEETSNTRRFPTDDEVEPALHPSYHEDPTFFPDDSTLVFPGDQAVKAALHGLWTETAGAIQRRLIRYILFRIELTKMDEDRFTEPLSFGDSLTLEHIMPKKWRDTWNLPIAEESVIYRRDSSGGPSVSVNSEVGEERLLYADLFSDEYRENNPNLERPSREGLIDESYLDAFNLALVRDDLLQSVGNLTLVTPPLNSSLGNKTFSKKKEALNEHSLLKLNREICRCDDWNVNIIRERSEKLMEYFYKIWPSLDWFAENICPR